MATEFFGSLNAIEWQGRPLRSFAGCWSCPAPEAQEPDEHEDETARDLRSVLTWIADNKPQRGPSPSEKQRNLISTATNNLIALARPLDVSADVDEKGTIRSRLDSTSLLGMYGAMILKDLEGGDRIAKCQLCHTPFIYPHGRATFCRNACRWTYDQRERRANLRT